MKTPIIARSLIAAAIALTSSAQASFHLWAIQEVFSNGDGTVQFIELFTTSPDEVFTGGHTITFEINTTIQKTVTLADLSSATTNKTLLVGTANLGTLYGVTPDVVIPANFFSPGANNFINFASGTDRVNLTSLPTTGTTSLNGMVSNYGQTSADTSVNPQATPKNFAGQTATIPEPAAAVLAGLAMGVTALRRRRR